MKKFLSLVLALVMTMSLVTVGAGAAYSDADDVNYTEAIEVMSKIGVISGYEDGSIKPQGSLTRGAAAKIICNLVLGPTDANALKVTEAPYKDVPANSTFAGYISFCKSEGIVDGYADGTFRPGAPLTGYAFMKMLLVTLGFDSTIEGYAGTSNWSVNVAKRALNLGLDDGLVSTFNGTKAVNREEAMLFAFNAMNCDTYGYQDKGTNITVGGITVNTGASKADKAWGTLNKLYEDVTNGDLDKNGVTDTFGRPATQWVYKDKEIGVYAKDPKVTYTTNVDQKTVYNKLGLTGASATFQYYLNGVYKNNVTVAKNPDIDLANSQRGTINEIYYKADGSLHKVVTITPKIAKIADVTKNVDGDRVVLIAGKEYKTEQFAKGDYVVYTQDLNGDVKTAYAVEKQSGTVTKKVGTGTIYIDGVKFQNNVANVANFNSFSVKDKVDFYCDEYGYIIKISNASATAKIDDLAFVNQQTGSVKGTSWVKWYTANASKATVADIKGSNHNAYRNRLVQYTLDGDVYKTEVVGSSYYSGYVKTYNKGTATFVYAAGNTTVNLNGKTTFLLIDGEGNATTYTGIKNVPTFDYIATTVYCEKNDLSEDCVLVVAKTVSQNTNSANMTFLVYNEDGTNDDGDGKVYNTYTSLCKGNVSTLDVVSGTFTGDETTTYDNYVIVVKNYSVNTKGVATVNKATRTTEYLRVKTISEPKNDVIELNGVAKTLADDCAVYMVSKAGKVTPATLEDIIEQDATMVHYNSIIATWNTDHEIDQIILCTKR